MYAGKSDLAVIFLRDSKAYKYSLIMIYTNIFKNPFREHILQNQVLTYW